jgi:hypothetical protein
MAIQWAAWPAPEPNAAPARRRKPRAASVVADVRMVLVGSAYRDTRTGFWRALDGTDGALVRGPQAAITAAALRLRAHGFAVSVVHNFTALPGVGWVIFISAAAPGR